MRIFDRRSGLSMPIRLAWLSAALVAGLNAAPAWSEQLSPQSATEAQPTAAGAIATDEHWSLAELTGDTAFLNELLLPEYRSVSPDGSANSKTQIIAGAARRAGTDLETAIAKIKAYRRDHAYGTSVVLFKDVAIASFYDPARGPQNGVKSSDILIYVGGRWHAIYSQHAAAEVAKS